MFILILPCVFSRHVLTPYLQPNEPSKERYNRSHRKTRVLIEQVFGRWKRRFYILQSHARVFFKRVPLVAACCAILHNIAIDTHMPDIVGDVNLEEEADPDDDGYAQDDQGLRYRDSFRVRHFYV